MKKNKGVKVNRYTALIILLFLIYGAILSKLVVLQVVKYEDYKDRANNTSTRQIAEQAPRGKIIDSTGAILADSKQSYAVQYMETDESKKVFFDTMTKVFAMLDELGEVQTDEFKLKLDESGHFYMDYNSTDPSAIRTMDLRFKKDRNMDFYLKKEIEYFKDLDEDKYSEEDLIKLDEELLAVTPEDMFYRLVKQYELYKLVTPNPSEEETAKYNKMTGKEITDMLLEKYSLKDLRRYVVIKDAIKMQSYSGYNPTTIATNISDESAFVFMQKLNDLPGIDVRYQPVRYYPYGSIASSVIGYMSSINSTQQEEYELKGYDASTDKIGVSGIEAAFEDRLKGTKGGTTVKVNKYGRINEELFSLEAYPGENIQLSLDINLQYTAERALRETLADIQKKRVIDNGKNIVANANRGAVVVTEVDTGRVLAMASNPDFDPNIFTIPGLLTDELSKKYFTPDYEAYAKEYIKRTGSTKSPEQLFSDNYTVDTYDIYPKPFFNYATQALVPTGSTFKFVTATAALEEGLVNPSERILDQGIFNKYPEFTNYQGKCDIYLRNGGSHGYVDMAEAFRVSCNYYFYELAYRLYKKDGIDKLAEYAWKLGLGYNPETATSASTGIEIYENKNGQVYSSNAYANLVASMAKFDIVDMLSSGTYTYAPSMGKKHNPFNIVYNSKDDEGLAKAKQDIKDYVAQMLKEKGNGGNNDDDLIEIKEELIKKLKVLVSQYEEADRGKYTDNDYDNAAFNVARYIVYDKAGDISSPGNLTNSSIGLGMNQFTPLQLTNALATVVNGGKRYQSHVVDKILSPDNEVVEEFKPVIIEDLQLKESTVRAVKAGMARVHSTGAFANFPIPTGGKTGTAIYRNDAKDIGRTDYGVYIAFAPVENPKIAITAVLYDSAHGSSVAPVVKAVMETYFRDIIKTQYPGYSSGTTSYTLDPPVTQVYTGKE